MKRLLQYTAIVIALAGLADSIYLTIHHYNGEAVPCSITGGCETVLTSLYAEIYGVPLGLYGAAAYFTAFALALLAVYGNSFTWKLYGLLSATMFLFSCWLIFVQWHYINAFCQFCLLSALTSTILFVLFLISLSSRSDANLSSAERDGTSLPEDA
jgi:uncharacterized membrane protein